MTVDKTPSVYFVDQNQTLEHYNSIDQSRALEVETLCIQGRVSSGTLGHFVRDNG